MNFIVDDIDVVVKINYKNIKKIYVRVEFGVIVITASKHAKNNQILDLLTKNRATIENEIRLFRDGESYLHYGGLKYKWRVVDSKRNELVFANDELVFYADSKKRIEKLINRLYITLIEEVINEERLLIAEFTKTRPIVFSFRSLKTQFGNYHRLKSRITLNTRLGKFPPVFIKAILIHELCHIEVGNHSSQFYQLLMRKMPNYSETIKKYKRLANYDPF